MEGNDEENRPKQCERHFILALANFFLKYVVVFLTY